MIDNKQYTQPSLWKRGKEDFKKFSEIKLKRATNAKTFIFGMLLAVLIILPLGLMILQTIMIYGYQRKALSFYLLIIWVNLMVFNGLSNYFTVKIAQAYVKDMDNLQKINAGAIFYYQLLNIGFAILSLFILVIGAIIVLGAE